MDVILTTKIVRLSSKNVNRFKNIEKISIDFLLNFVVTRKGNVFQFRPRIESETKLKKESMKLRKLKFQVYITMIP